MNEEINRIRWKCRRGMREIDLLLREFSITKLETLNEDELSIFSDILNNASLSIKYCESIFSNN